MLLLLPPSPGEFRDKPEAGSSSPIVELNIFRIEQHKQQQRTAAATATATMKGEETIQANAAQVDDEWGARSQDKPEVGRQGHNIMKSSNRITTTTTGDRWILSSSTGDRLRRGNIFLRSSELKDEDDRRNSQSPPPPVKHHQLESHHHKDGKDTCCCLHQQRLSPFQGSSSPQFTTTTTRKSLIIDGRPINGTPASSVVAGQPPVWLAQRRAPMSKFISLSATSVCLLSASATKLLLQLVLITMLIMIMIPLSSVKCPNVLLAMAAHHRHDHQLPAIPASSHKLIGSNHQQQQLQAPLSSTPNSKTPLDGTTTTTTTTTTHKSHHHQREGEPPFYNDNDGGGTMLKTSPTMGNSMKVSKLSEQEKSITQDGMMMEEEEEDPSANRKRAKRAANYELGCGQFASFWNFFRGSYPSLATHLFSLATTLNGDDNHLMAQASKTIARLLEEADRIVRDQQASLSSGKFPAHTTSGGSVSSSSSAAWLAKIKASPFYNRIIQNFRHNKQLVAERNRQNLIHDPPMALNAGRPATEQETPPGPTDGQSKQHGDSSSLTSTPAPDDSHVYGRIIHYPHEANNNGASKTLDKLKQLNQQRHGPEVGQQQQINEIDRLAGDGVGGDYIESNRIPLVAGDGEQAWRQQQQHQHQSRFDPDHDADSARNKYVYGDVLLRPSQKDNNQQQQLNNHHNHHHRHSSLGTLRQLSDDLDRSMRLDEQQLHTSGDTGDLLPTQQQQQQQYHNEQPKSKSYGRVLVSPPDRTQATTDNEWTQNTYSKEKDASGAETGDTSASGGGSNELAAQLFSGTMAANAQSDHFKDDEWSLEPFQHVEARKLRSSADEMGIDRTQVGSAEPEVVVQTTTAATNAKQAMVVD